MRRGAGPDGFSLPLNDLHTVPYRDTVTRALGRDINWHQAFIVEHLIPRLPKLMSRRTGP